MSVRRLRVYACDSCEQARYALSDLLPCWELLSARRASLSMETLTAVYYPTNWYPSLVFSVGVFVAGAWSWVGDAPDVRAARLLALTVAQLLISEGARSQGSDRDLVAIDQLLAELPPRDGDAEFLSRVTTRWRRKGRAFDVRA